MIARQVWQGPLQSLRNFSRRAKAERCELCALEIGQSHRHLIDPANKQVICSCDGCSMLFDAAGATKLKRIPRDVLLLSPFQLSDEEWKDLLVPIQLGFIYRNSRTGRRLASYPSPFGVTEALVEDPPWQAIVRRNPRLDELQDDVEALLVNRMNGEREYFIAPIDRCFEIVGLVRRHWKGISGGDRVWSEVKRYLADLKGQARS